jgi:hypothetical protein
MPLNINASVYLVEFDSLSSLSDEQFDDDFCSDAEAIAFESERDLNVKYHLET